MEFECLKDLSQEDRVKVLGQVYITNEEIFLQRKKLTQDYLELKSEELGSLKDFYIEAMKEFLESNLPPEFRT